MAVSHCPIDLHFVSLMVPVIATIHLTVRGKKRARKGKSQTPSLSLSRSLVSNKQATPLCCSLCVHACVHARVFASACAHAYMIYRENMRGCASLAVCACPLCCMISHWSVHGGAADMSDPAADQKRQRLVPLWPARGGLISTRLCSVDRKNKGGETGSGGGREGWGGASAGTQKQAGEAQMKECTKRPV